MIPAMSGPSARVPVDVLLDADLPDIPRAVAELTEAGADGLFTFEGPRDPFLPLAVAATVPSRALLYPNLAIALPRSPMNLAQLVTSIAGFGETAPAGSLRSNSSASGWPRCERSCRHGSAESHCSSKAAGHGTRTCRRCSIRGRSRPDHRRS